MSLQERLDAFKADFENNRLPFKVTPEIVETMRRATEELVQSGAASRALDVGALAPDFTLPDPEGTLVSSASLLASGPLVVSFYRGVWCPYCNFELQALEEVVPAIRAAGASLIAISPQTPVNSRKSVRQNKLSFPILSDFGNEVAAKFGLRFRLPDDLVKLYQGFGNDLPVVNGEPSWTLPMPARFVIDPDRRIRYAEVNPDYTKRPEPVAVIAALRAVRSEAA